jgi:hypothetical protein
MPNEYKPGHEPLKHIIEHAVPPPEDNSDVPVQWRPKPRMGCFTFFFRLGLTVFLLAACIIPFTPYGARVKVAFDALTGRSAAPRIITKDVVKEVIKEVPRLDPLPSTFVPRKEVDVATLYNGIQIKTTLTTSEGGYASLEIGDKESYTAEFQLKLRVPKANQTVPELARINPELPKVLPALPQLLANGKVSGFYHKLYENKVSNIEHSLTRLNKVLDRHNFFDCETILELQHPVTKRNALLIQSEMDVVADGSDGDRMATMDASIYNSDYYQPFTSYTWAKQTTTPNPLLARWQSRYEATKAAAGAKGISTAKANELKAEMQHLSADITGLKTRSSLIGDKDPFIVISLLFKDYPRIMAQAPSIGDYCAVIHGNQILPAICGDYGPSMKMGEASLLIAKKINDKATPYIRGEDDLKVSYLIFPGTADKPFGAPNLDKWHEKVSAYLKEIGGVGEGYTVHKWENPFPPKPAPVVAGDTTKGPDGKPIEVKPAEPAGGAAPANAPATTPASSEPPTTTVPAPADKPASAPVKATSDKPKTTTKAKAKKTVH